MNSDALANYDVALKQLQEAASKMGIGVAEMASVLREFAQNASEIPIPGDEKERKYKTLSWQHEIL